jgi:hypothetical protein
MKRLTMTVAAIALSAGGAFAQTATDENNMEQAETNMEQAGENMEQATENAGEAIENSAENAGQEMENAADEAGRELDQAAAETGQNMQDIFGMDEDGLIRSRDITGGAVYAVNEDAAMGDADVAEGEPTMGDEAEMAEGDAAMGADTEMTGTDADAQMNAEGGMATNGGMGSYTEIGDNWQNVGEIEDIVFTADGMIEGVVAEVGGFLDIGDKHVHISLSDVQLMPIDDGTYALVTNYTKDQLMEMPDMDESAMQ